MGLSPHMFSVFNGISFRFRLLLLPSHILFYFCYFSSFYSLIPDFGQLPMIVLNVHIVCIRPFDFVFFIKVISGFMGWTATALVWAQVILLTNDYKLPTETLGHALKTSVPFWLVVVMTGSIILPWLRLRRVPVRAKVLSSHAVRLYFDYGQYLGYF